VWNSRDIENSANTRGVWSINAPTTTIPWLLPWIGLYRRRWLLAKASIFAHLCNKRFRRRCSCPPLSHKGFRRSDGQSSAKSTQRRNILLVNRIPVITLPEHIYLGDVPRVRVHPSQMRHKDHLPGFSGNVLCGVHVEATRRGGIRRVDRVGTSRQLWECPEENRVEAWWVELLEFAGCK
jgi:hypothetical protein